MGDLVKVGLEKFNNGYNCFQAVACTFCEEYGLSVEDCFRLGSGFGGGLKSGETCGTASGGVLILGLKFGPRTPNDTESAKMVTAKTKYFMAKFKEAHGCYTCSELLNATPAQRAAKTPEDQAADRSHCCEIVKKSIEILIELGC